ncbi:hypothetical protein ACQZV8_17190 [Magnetococcales bacterium HHB-1]
MSLSKYTKKISFVFILLSLWLVHSHPVHSQPVHVPNNPRVIDLFDGQNVYGEVIPLACKPAPARHGIRLSDEGIVWTWRKQQATWCAWTFDGLDLDLSAYLNTHSLEILYRGRYIGSPSPQVKFLDERNHACGLKDFSQYSEGTNRDGDKIVLIPLSEFALDFSLNPSAVEKMQFDVGWGSLEGDLEIRSIRLIPLR